MIEDKKAHLVLCLLEESKNINKEIFDWTK